MSDRPILFSAPMVRSLLDGTKTQTRRIVKWRDLAPGLNLGFSGLSAHRYMGGWVLESPTRTSSEWRCEPTPCPYGEAGDRLWVRETWAPVTVGYAYAADPFWNASPAGRWRPSIHMPRGASRITLEIAAVRVERLQDISESDARAEGIVALHGGGFGLPDGSHFHAVDPRISYWSLWDAINGAGAVEANPWAWCVSFSVGSKT